MIAIFFFLTDSNVLILFVSGPLFHLCTVLKDPRKSLLRRRKKSRNFFIFFFIPFSFSSFLSSPPLSYHTSGTHKRRTTPDLCLPIQRNSASVLAKTRNQVSPQGCLYLIFSLSLSLSLSLPTPPPYFHLLSPLLLPPPFLRHTKRFES